MPSGGPVSETGERLSPDEDAELRRLHWFETLGCELSRAMRTLKDGFRSRDRRKEIREPGATYDPRTKKAADSYWAS
jgi:hypothetical protein